MPADDTRLPRRSNSQIMSRAARGTLLLAVVTSCHRDAKHAEATRDPGGLTSAATASDTAAVVALVAGAIAPRSQRDTDSSGTGIVDGDLRPGTAAAADSNPPTRPHDDASAPATLPSPTGIPLVKGLTLTSALQFPDGDRENVVTVSAISSDAVTYRWRFLQLRHDGTVERHSASRPVSQSDLASAPRLDEVFEEGDQPPTPGYTAMSLSRAVFARVSSGSPVAFTVTNVETGSLFARLGTMTSARMNYHGTLTRVSSALEPMPVLLDGVRTQVPVLHLRGRFTLQEKTLDTEFWVLADSTNPLLMRSIEQGDVLQVIRIDRPHEREDPVFESELTHECRAELPGIYFAFGSAELEPESRPSLASVAALMSRHSDWSLAIEGHTDSIGGAASNQTLSERRASAVRTALISQFHIDATRLRSRGFGAKRPKEPNTTLEGRARNRRVEVVRPCGTSRG
jgi:outer membrane protein OmpA-like peptidoglycan-associated protein